MHNIAAFKNRYIFCKLQVAAQLKHWAIIPVK